MLASGHAIHEENEALHSQVIDLKGQIMLLEAEKKAIKVECGALAKAEAHASKMEGYQEGKDEATKELAVKCTPFLEYNDAFMRTRSVCGYKYQLLVKGIPVFEPAKIIIEDRKGFNNGVRETLLKAANAAIDLALVAASHGGFTLIKAADEVRKIAK